MGLALTLFLMVTVEYSLGVLRDMARRKGTAMTELLIKHINVEEKMSSTNQVDREILLEAAAEAGLVDIVRQILERGIHGDTRPWGSQTFQQDRPGVDTPLTLAIKNGQEKVVALLLEYGGYPYRVGCRPPSPIQMAANQGSKEMVELLLNRDLDLRRRSYPIASYASPPLLLGICVLYDAMEFPPVFQLLLDRGALNKCNGRAYSSGPVPSLLRRVIRSEKVGLIGKNIFVSDRL